MKPRHKIRPDANQSEIISHLEAHGVDVLDLSKMGNVPDLLVRFGQRSGFLELKIPGSRACFTKEQVRWIAETRWPVRIVTNKDDALEFAKTHEGALTESQKYRLRPLLEGKARDIRPADVLEAMK